MRSRPGVPVALRFALRLLPREVRDDVLGDLLEERATRAETLSRWRLMLWDGRQVGAALRWRMTRKAPRRRRSFAWDKDLLRRRSGAPVSWLDVKLAFRMMRRQPLLTVVAGLTLALGIPSSLFPAHVMGILDGSFPVEEGHRIVGLRNWNLETGRPEATGVHELAVWKETLRSFESIGAARPGPWNVHSADGRAEEVRGAQVSASVFEMLRTPPLQGRVLLDADEAPGGPDVAVISQALWASRFGGDPDIVGKTVEFGRVPHTVVGIMPEGFLFPRAELFWLPLRTDPDAHPVGDGPAFQVFGRLADGVTVEAAEAELRTVGARLAAAWPETHVRLRPEVVSIGRLEMDAPATGWADGFEIIQLIALGLLFVACGNVGTLVLARTATRTGEMSVRTALGASRSRILGQLFVELFVLAVVATGVGLILADRVAALAISLLVPVIPYWFDPSVGLRSALLAMGLAAVCAVSAGVLPAWRATRSGVQGNLKDRAAGSSLRFGIAPTVLIVAEVALSVGFLAFGAAATTASTATNPVAQAALDMDRHLVMSWQTPQHVLTDSTSEQASDGARAGSSTTHDELQRRLLADPATSRVAMGWDLPGIPFPPDRRVEVEGRTLGEGVTAPRVVVARVHFGFFEDLGRPILNGRSFTSVDAEIDDSGDSPAVVVNAQFVEQMLGGTEAIGRRIRYQDGRGSEQNQWYEIIGVVGDLAMNPHNPGRGAGVYHPIGAAEGMPMRYIIELRGDPEAFVPRARQIAASVDADAVVQNPRVLSDIVEETRVEMTLISLFTMMLSLVGALLAATGLYALMSFTVSQRTREIGIRTALGARAASIVSTIATRAAAQLFCGVAFGVAFGYWVVTDSLNELYRPVPNTMALVSVVGAVVLLVGAVACLVPTLRGLRIQPTEALGSEG